MGPQRRDIVVGLSKNRTLKLRSYSDWLSIFKGSTSILARIQRDEE